MLLSAAGRSISPAEHGAVRVEREAGDEAGHELIEIWQSGAHGYTRRTAAVRGGSALPRTPESAALMLGQAMLRPHRGGAGAAVAGRAGRLSNDTCAGNALRRVPCAQVRRADGRGGADARGGAGLCARVGDGVRCGARRRGVAHRRHSDGRMTVFFRAVRTVPLFFIMMRTTRRDDRVKHLKK